MRGTAVFMVLKRFVLFLLMAALFPLLWLRSLAIAKKHRDTDPRATLKVALGIVVGVGLLVVAGSLTWNFQQDAVEGTYETLDSRMASALSVGNYNTAVEGNDDAERDRLQANKELYDAIVPVIAAHDDARLVAMVEGRSEQVTDDDDLEERMHTFLILKDDAVGDIETALVWFVYPGLIGVFYAPLVLAVGNVLKHAWTESSSVGFKPYPHGAAGLFLLFGAFGLPALPFSAWVFMDLDSRSEEGQIAL